MSLQPTGTGERGEGSLAPTFVPAKVHQFSKEIPHYPLPGASATVRPTPPDFSMVPPPQEAPNHQTGAQLTPPASIQSLQALFPWIASVPERLQQKLLWGSVNFKHRASSYFMWDWQTARAWTPHCTRWHQLFRGMFWPLISGESRTTTFCRVHSMTNSAPMHGRETSREREVARIVGLGVSSRNQGRQSDAQNLNVGACQHYSLGNRWTLTTTACFSYG